MTPYELSQEPLVKYNSGNPVAQLGCSMTFYFGSPGKRERRLALLKALELYCLQAKKSNAQLAEYAITDDKRTRKLKPNQLPDLSLLLPMVDDKPDFVFELGGAPEGIASHWSANALALKVMRANYLGYMLLAYPLSIFDQIGHDGFIRQFSTICNDLDVEHAYAGLSAIFPYDVGGMKAARQMSGHILTRYPGLEAYNLNTTASNFGDGIKSVNFLTAVSHRLLEKAGGTQTVLANLDPQVWQCEYSNGIIFQAGQQPELGAENQPPPAYVALGKALKDVREDFKKTMFYDPEGKGDDHDVFTQRWLARFDG